MVTAKERLIVALDVDTVAQAEALVAGLREYVGVFKVGMQLFNSEGPEIIHRIHKLGAKVFLDLKLHDIPNTVGQAAAVLTRLGVFMYNIHIAGGTEMMKKAVALTHKESEVQGISSPLVIGVTVLTSINQEILEHEIGILKSVEGQVVHWAQMAKNSGLNGVVASPREIKAIRAACGQEFVIITPGVRPAWAEVNDQKRIMTPKEAMRAGASYLVVGRPITGAENPSEAAERIVREMEEGLVC